MSSRNFKMLEKMKPRNSVRGVNDPGYHENADLYHSFISQENLSKSNAQTHTQILRKIEHERSNTGTLGDMIAQIPLNVRAGRRAPNAVSFFESAKYFGVDRKPILFINTQYPRNLRQNSLHTVIMVLKPTDDARQPDMGKDFRFRAMICFQKRYKHYVCFVARDSKYGHWLLFNDLPGLEGRPRNRHGKPLDLESWHDVADTCARHGFTPTLLLYERDTSFFGTSDDGDDGASDDGMDVASDED